MKDSTIEENDVPQSKAWSDQEWINFGVIVIIATMFGSKYKVVRPMAECSSAHFFVEWNARRKYVYVVCRKIR